MNILVIGDPHIKVGSLQRCQTMIDKIMIEVRQKKPDVIVCTGDLLDRFANIRMEPLKMGVDFLEALRNEAQTFFLVGNHSRKTNDVFCTEEHPFTAVKKWGNTPHPITIVDVPINVIIHGIQLTMCPYTPNGRFIEALETFSQGWKKSSMIFAHQDFLFAKYNNQESTTGDDISTIEECPLIVSGHIHDFQILKNKGKDLVIYVGSPMQHAFSESPEKSLSWFKVTKKNIDHERIKIETPIYWTFKLNYKEVAKYKPPTLPENSDMKLVIEGTFTELKGIHKMAKIVEWRKQGIRIQPSILVDKTSIINPSHHEDKVPFIVQLKQYLTPELVKLITDEN